MPNEFPSNSKSKVGKEREKIKSVTTAKVISRPKPILMKIFGDNTRSVGAYILWDVLLPAAKSTISDMISNGIEMLLYGEPQRKNVRRDKGRSYVSYNSMYNDRDREDRRTRITPRNRSKQRFDDVVIASRAEAEEVLSALVELIDTYEIATVADFYDAVDVEGEFTDHKYGWDNLSTATVVRVREGYILELPKPLPID